MLNSSIRMFLLNKFGKKVCLLSKKYDHVYLIIKKSEHVAIFCCIKGYKQKNIKREIQTKNVSTNLKVQLLQKNLNQIYIYSRIKYIFIANFFNVTKPMYFLYK